MRFLSLLALLFATYVTVAFDQPFDEDEDDNADGELDPDNETLMTIGDRCGRKSNFCEHGLDCVRAPVLRRCLPVTCVGESFQKALNESGFDLANYGHVIMEQAGVSKDSPVFRSFPNPRNFELLDLDNHYDEALALVGALEENRPPMDLFLEHYNKCIGPKASSAGVTPYFGASWELGAVLTYNADIYWG
jgi:hypothetical protein